MLEPGDILLVKGAGLISWLIRLFTCSQYSHAMLYVGEFLEPLVVEAGARGVWINTLRAHGYEYDRIDVYRVKAPQAYRHQTPRAAFEYVSRPYGFLDLLGFISAIFSGLRVNPFNNTESIICSELIDLAYLGLWSLEEGTKGLVSPETIASSKYTKKLGGLKEVLVGK